MGESIIEYEPQAPSTARRRAPILLLLAITLFGGVLRFWKLSEPALWGDEGATYSRICGTYQDLIDILQFNGFVPLHYEVYHWVEVGMPLWARVEQGPVKPVPQRGRFFFSKPATEPTSQPTTKPYLYGEHPIVPGGVRMTPFVMRLVPAIAGTLMIPAMYFLAMQMVNRRAALIAAMFTAGSAYLLVYSRDAKMYMHFWLFCTLSVGCLLWWLRVRTRIAWLCWVAASLAMCGLHAPGAVLLAIELLIFLSYDRQWWISGCILVTGFVLSGLFHGQTRLFSTAIDDRWLVCGFALILGIVAFFLQRRRDWKPVVFFILGLSVILSGIGGYYLKFNHFKERIEEGSWNASMLQWVDGYNRGRETQNLFTFPATAYLLSWEWAQPTEEKFIDPRALKLLHGAVYVTVALLLLGLLPWRRRQTVTRVSNPCPDGTARVENPCYTDALGRRVLWIFGWIILPAYAFYCVSMGADSTLNKGVWNAGFVSPNWAVVELWQSIHPFRAEALIVACAIAVCIYLGGRSWHDRLMKTVGVLAALTIIYALCGGIFLLMNDLNHRAIANDEHWHSLWMPRYLGIVWPAFAIGVGTLLSRLPTRPLRYGAVAFVLLVNLAQFSARLRASEPPTETIARDMLAAGSTRTYLLGTFSHGMSARPGEGLFSSVAWRYYMAELSGAKVSPREFRTDLARFVTEFKPNLVRDPARIATDLKRAPGVSQVVVWDKIEQFGIDADRDDPVRHQLGGDWSTTSEQTFSAFDHWTWQKLYDVRRREYLRVGK